MSALASYVLGVLTVPAVCLGFVWLAHMTSWQGEGDR